MPITAAVSYSVYFGLHHFGALLVWYLIQILGDQATKLSDPALEPPALQLLMRMCCILSMLHCIALYVHVMSTDGNNEAFCTTRSFFLHCPP